MEKTIEIDKIYVIMKDEKGNFHQGVLKLIDEQVIKRLVKVLPNNNFEKKIIDDLKVLCDGVEG